jgi:glutathione S-transferase
LYICEFITSSELFRYEEINVDLTEKPEWYLKRNAPGQVPGLEWIDPNTKETRFIPESLIVSDYLDELNPEQRLQPTDPYLKAKQRLLVERFSNVNQNLSFKKKTFHLFLISG